MHLARGVLDTLTAVATIVVVTFLMLIEGPRMMRERPGRPVADRAGPRPRRC